MKIAFIGDLHGNFIATQALERELRRQQVEEIWFLGDAVGKGPQNVATCDWVRANCKVCIGGNWDYGIGGKEFAEDGYFWDQLGPERMEWLRTLPSETDAWISGTHFRLFHGRPVTPLISAQVMPMMSAHSATPAAPVSSAQNTMPAVIRSDTMRRFCSPFMRCSV